jgi:osmotically-inducible protein OsmY
MKGVSVEPWARDALRRPQKGASVADRRLKQTVEDAFLYDPRIRSNQIRITVVGQKVTIAGRVDTGRAKRAAEDTARNSVGAMAIRNRLHVGYLPPRSPAKS